MCYVMHVHNAIILMRKVFTCSVAPILNIPILNDKYLSMLINNLIYNLVPFQYMYVTINF